MSTLEAHLLNLAKEKGKIQQWDVLAGGGLHVTATGNAVLTVSANEINAFCLGLSVAL